MTYDERLLASAPVATRAEKQEGYNIDLLENDAKPNVRSTSATPPPAAPTLAADRSQAEAGGYAYAPAGRSGYASTTPPKPWYKTRKWLIIFLIGGIAAVAAIVGGAVGGTVGHNKSSAPAASSLPIGGGSPEGVTTAASSDSGIGIGTTGGGGQATDAVGLPATTGTGNSIGTTTTSADEASPTGDDSHGGTSGGKQHGQGGGGQAAP